MQSDLVEALKVIIQGLSPEEKEELMRDSEPTLNVESISVKNFLRKQLINYKQNGEKLAAVKLVKDVTGNGLKESKDWVDFVWEII